MTRMTDAGRMTARVAKHFRWRNPRASKMRIPDWVPQMNARPTWSKFRQHGFSLLKTCAKLRTWGDFAGAKHCLQAAKKAREMEQLHKEST